MEMQRRSSLAIQARALFFLFAYLLVVDSLCCQQPSRTGDATTKAPCSPAVTGDKNSFSINCGIGATQGRQLLAIVNRILENQLDPTLVMDKLNDIQLQLQGLDPSTAHVTYLIDGRERITSPGGNIIRDNAENDRLFAGMQSDFAKQDWKRLLDDSQSAIAASPKWFTAEYYRGIALLRLGQLDDAEMQLRKTRRDIATQVDYQDLLPHVDDALKTAESKRLLTH